VIDAKIIFKSRFSKRVKHGRTNFLPTGV